jgi:hypothetical protein
MSRRKRISKVLEKAQLRASSLQSISIALDLGNGLTIDAYTQAIDKLDSTLHKYNRMLSEIDQVREQIRETETDLRNLSEHMLIGVAAKYGKDSQEYVMAGGIRKSQRRRPTRTKPASIELGEPPIPTYPQPGQFEPTMVD